MPNSSSEALRNKIREMLALDHNTAIEICRADIAACSSDVDDEQLADLWFVLARVYMAAPLDAETRIEQVVHALHVVEPLNNKTHTAYLTSDVSGLYWDTGNYADAMKYGQQALTLFEELNDERGIAGANKDVGLTYYRLGELDKAFDHLSKSLAINEQLGNSQSVSGEYHNIANILSNLGDFDKALEYYTKALEINTTLGNNGWVAKNYNGISQVYTALGDHKKAIEYAEKSLATQKEPGDPYTQAVLWFQLGACMQNTNNYEKAYECNQRALQIANDAGLMGISIVFKSAVGALLAKKDWIGADVAEAERILLESVEQMQEGGLKQQLFETYEILRDLYKNEGRWEEAFTYYDKYVELRNSVVSDEAKTKAHQYEQMRAIADREKDVAIAKAASDARINATSTLLYKVLPESVAERLVNGERIADYYQNVSILFADIVGFTSIASRMPARAVLGFLNYVFGEFDRIVDSHGCEKIKTIGDGYLAVAGAPTECTDHAERIARVAIEMLSDVKLPQEILSSLPANALFNIRIGIHTGPCFAGIVGEKRFVYDVYSDAVNVAARMESHGEPGKITVSEEFAFHLQNRLDALGTSIGNINFHERDVIEVKGKGLMKTYFMSTTDH